MKRIVIATAMSLCVVSLAAPASADTLVMRDGTRIEGTLTGFAAGTITFRQADGTSRRYPASEVEALEFQSADRGDPRDATSRGLEAPAGTELVVRTVEAIDSHNAGADQTFSAIVEQNVMDASGSRDRSRSDPALSWSSGRCRRVARPAVPKWRWTSGRLPSTGGDT